MTDITDEELSYLKETVDKLNADGNVTYQLVEIKGTYYIHPQFPAKV